MGLTNSVSFWTVVFSLIFACFIGSFTHWIVGTVIFFLVAGKALIFGIILDTISGSLRYHHDREDERAKKIIISNAVLRASNAGVRPASRNVFQKFKK